jgi:hypothetical protein
MSRKVILTLATAATIAVSALASSAADAHGFGGGGFGGGHGGGFGRMGGGGFGHFGHFGHSSFYRPGRWGHWNHWSHWNHWNHWRHWGYYHHRWYWPGYGYGVYGGLAPVGAVSGPIANPTPGPCTCLTKTYTQDGLVVFADLCTKESASAPVGDTNSSEAAPQDPRSGG